MVAKGGRPDRGKGVRHGLVAQGCRVQHGPGEQVERIKTASAGRSMQSGGNGRLFGQVDQDRNEGGKLVTNSGADQSQGGGWKGELGHGG